MRNGVDGLICAEDFMRRRIVFMKSYFKREVNLSDLPAKDTGNRTEATMTISTKNLTCSKLKEENKIFEPSWLILERCQ